MPYQWNTPDQTAPQTLRLWPHQSLPAKGFAGFILVTFFMILIPVIGLLGTTLLWGILPFALGAVAAIYYALTRNHTARLIEETLTITQDTAHLRHQSAKGEIKEWSCNRYWVKVIKHATGGPVPHYITLRGNGREVEIGAFLSEEERLELFDELERHLHGARYDQLS